MRNRLRSNQFGQWFGWTILVLVSLLIGGHTRAADAPAKPLKDVSKDAGDAQAQYLADIDKLKSDYLDKLNALQQQYLKQLDACQVVETRKGNLDGGVAIRQEIATQKATSPDSILQQGAEPAAGFLDGKWRLRGTKGAAEYYFHDKVIKRIGGTTSAVYTIENGSVIVHWSSGWVNRFTPVQNRLLFEDWSETDASRFPLESSGFGIAVRE